MPLPIAGAGRKTCFTPRSNAIHESACAFLQEACGTDTELFNDVESLLRSAEEPVDFLSQAVMEVAHSMKSSGQTGSAAAGVQPARSRETIASGTLLAHYKVLSLLGTGGMGEVYLAEDMRLRRKVALKMLQPELTADERGLQRFEQEAHAASALNHPNILTIYEFGQTDGWNFIASEYVEGVTLRQKISNGPVEVSAAIDIAAQIASALSAAHASGIVHRDIKPENVIVRSDGIVKVLDFGIAKLSPRRQGQTTRRTTAVIAVQTTEAGMVRGTVKYMSPEQARGRDVDARSDLFSLGSVLYELVTGNVAFAGETTSDVIAEILKAEPRPPTEFSPQVPAGSGTDYQQGAAQGPRDQIPVGGRAFVGSAESEVRDGVPGEAERDATGTETCIRSPEVRRANAESTRFRAMSRPGSLCCWWFWPSPPISASNESTRRRCRRGRGAWRCCRFAT